MTKVRHSVFYATPLDALLRWLDAYLRHYPVVVSKDAVAHIDRGLGAAALAMMERTTSAELLPAAHRLR